MGKNMIIPRAKDADFYILNNDSITASFDEVVMEFSEYISLNFGGRNVVTIFKPKMTQVLRELHELGIKVVDARGDV